MQAVCKNAIPSATRHLTEFYLSLTVVAVELTPRNFGRRLLYWLGYRRAPLLQIWVNGKPQTEPVRALSLRTSVRLPFEDLPITFEVRTTDPADRWNARVLLMSWRGGVVP